jgi:hypothetical protein
MNANPMSGSIRSIWADCQQCFGEQYAVLWPNLSRATSLLAILNTSLFFLSGAVQCQGYYWPIYSLGLLGVVEVVLMLPLGLNRQLWYYLFAMALWMLAGWFFVGSILLWLRTAPTES